jgi:hypothetical protein
MILEIIGLIILSGGFVYFVWRSLTLANVTADQEEYIQELEDMSQYMYDQIKNSYDEMKKIDHKGAFESDDEAGTTFEFLKNVITNLENEFNGEKEEKVK